MAIRTVLRMGHPLLLLPAAPVQRFGTAELRELVADMDDTMRALNGAGIAAPQPQRAADGLPDARSRHNDIADKTAHAAEKVLRTVDSAKVEQSDIAANTRPVAASLLADPVRPKASGAVQKPVQDVESAIARIDGHLTDLLVAPDFHDLTGLVVAKVGRWPMTSRAAF